MKITYKDEVITCKKGTTISEILKKQIEENEYTVVGAKFNNEYKNLEYENINSLYGGTTYNVNLKEDEVILNATIDMNLIDINKMVKNKYIDKDYVVSNKLTVSGIKYIYKSKGAKCDIWFRRKQYA